MKCSVFSSAVAIVGLLLLVSAAAVATPTAEQPAEDVTLEVTFRNFGSAHEPDSDTELYMEELLGFQIEFDARPASNYDQTTQTILASGDYPDVLEAFFRDPEREIRELAEDGVIAPLDGLLEQYGQNILEARPFELSWYRPLPDGNTYAIQSRFNRDGIESVWIVRKDWLDNLGLEVPTTLDEFRDVARALTFDDPDGNGEDDTYGVAAGYSGSGSMWSYFLAAHGVAAGQWQELGGELVHNAVHPETLDALKFARGLYLDGVIDPEYMLYERPTWLENMREGRYGMQSWWNTHLDANASEWWAEFMRRQPEAEIAFIPPAPTPTGERIYPGSGIRGFSMYDIVFADAPAADQIAAIRFLDLLASEEGSYLGAFGIEGTHWDWVDGTLTSYLTGSEEQSKAGAYRFGWIFRRTILIPTNGLSRASLDFYSDYMVRPIIEVTVPAQSEYGGVLNELMQSRFLRIQTQEDLDVDAEWADFVETWMESGGAELTRQMNEAWKQ